MSYIKESLIRLGSTHPELRKDLKPILKTVEAAADRVVGEVYAIGSSGQDWEVTLVYITDTKWTHLAKEVSDWILKSSKEAGRHINSLRSRFDRYGLTLSQVSVEPATVGVESKSDLTVSQSLLFTTSVPVPRARMVEIVNDLSPLSFT